MQVDSPAHRPSDKTVDSWEDNAENSATPATTPEDEEHSGEAEAFVPASKPRTKVKPKPEEATTTEKEHVNVVFIGHVDAGKSTIGGQIMHLTGMVDKRTLEKYEREAKEKNRETWYLSWCMDTNLEGEPSFESCFDDLTDSVFRFQNVKKARQSRSAEASSRQILNILPSLTLPATRVSCPT